jgi:hypothetical protein
MYGDDMAAPGPDGRRPTEMYGRRCRVVDPVKSQRKFSDFQKVTASTPSFWTPNMRHFLKIRKLTLTFSWTGHSIVSPIHFGRAPTVGSWATALHSGRPHTFLDNHHLAPHTF